MRFVKFWSILGAVLIVLGGMGWRYFNVSADHAGSGMDVPVMFMIACAVFTLSGLAFLVAGLITLKYPRAWWLIILSMLMVPFWAIGLYSGMVELRWPIP